MNSAAPPTFVSGCAGIGGFDLALEREGFRCVLQLEIDPFCRRVLAKRFPGVVQHGDIRGYRADARWNGEGARPSAAGAGLRAGGDAAPSRAATDLLVGGFPCQGASVAGKRLGLADDRTALFWEFCRLGEEGAFPWLLLENVPGLRSVGLGHDFTTVLAALAERWPVVVWRSLDSRYFHVAQRRERVFFVGGPDTERTAAVLLEPEGGGGDSAARGEAGARAARSLACGAGSSGYRLDPNGEEFVVTGVIQGDSKASTPDLPSLRSCGDGGGSGHVNAIAYQQHGTNVGPMGALRKGDGGVTSGVPFIAHALSAEGADASEDGTGRGTPLVIQDVRGMDKRQNGRGVSTQDIAYTVDALATQGVADAGLVRRLTPLECERLQAFPDGWTCLCGATEAILADRGIPEAAWRLSDWRTVRLDEHVWRCTCPDGPRYRAMGNAVTVTTVMWIARRLWAVFR